MFAIVWTVVLSGCGGTKVLKEPLPIPTTQPLAIASDQRVTAILDWVIVRDGLGTWARNADWDEYLIRVSNHSDQPIQVVGGLLVLGPVLAVGGIVRGANNSAVNNQIELRQTRLPLVVIAGEELLLDVFFPIAPSPGIVEVMYTDADGEHSLIFETSAALNGLHMDTSTD